MIPIIVMNHLPKLILVACLITATVSEYTVVQTITNISTNITYVAITGDLNTLYVQDRDLTYFFNNTGTRYKIDGYVTNWPINRMNPNFNGSSVTIGCSVTNGRAVIQKFNSCYYSRLALEFTYFFGYTKSDQNVSLYRRKNV